MSGRPLVGRVDELGRVDAFVAAVATRASGLLIRGEPGIGKTAIWRAAVDRARIAGGRVLVARPAEEELQGSLIALIDLFEELDVEPALLDPETDLFVRGRALLSALRRLADTGPVVLAIDDVQWLDPISARSLRYALRRLDDQPVGVIATVRASSVARDDVATLLPEGSEVITVAPLDVGEIRELLTPTVTAVPRPTLELIHRLSGGNPMYALELARSPVIHEDRLAGSSRHSLHATLSARLTASAPAVRSLVQTAAALGPSSPERLEIAQPDGITRLADAIDEGLLTLDESMLVRCSHPLLGSVLLGEMDPVARRSLHGRLADVVDDPDDRARHLALSSSERDGQTAAELEGAAHRAGRRGAPGLAAELTAHSVRLTPLDDEQALARRTVAEILHRAAAGETARAIAMVDAILEGLPPGRERIAALTIRVGLDFGHAEEVLTLAKEEAEADELVHGRILDLLAYMHYMYRGDLAAARELATEALSIARRHRDIELEMLTSATVATAALLAGEPQPELLDRALELGARVTAARFGRWPDVEWARQCLWSGHLHEAREVFERRQLASIRSGLEFQRPYRLADLANVELAAGRLAVAAEVADDGLESALDAGNAPIAIWLRYPEGLAHAHLGHPERAGFAAAEMRAWGEANDELPRLLMAHHVAGIVALAAGDAEAALGELLDGVALGRKAGQAHPGVVPVLPDAIEAAAGAGAADVAVELARSLDEQAAALSLPWVDAAASRGRGLAAMATGDRRAPELLAEAGAALDALGYRLDAARAWWWRARALQVTGRKAPAADAFTDARDRFVSMGAAAWAVQATAALQRVAPGRATGSLTETEARLAALVSEGRRNREIAEALFVSVATVEAHLTRIYRKLGVRSRTGLAGYMRELDRPVPGGSDTVGM